MLPIRNKSRHTHFYFQLLHNVQLLSFYIFRLSVAAVTRMDMAARSFNAVSGEKLAPLQGYGVTVAHLSSSVG